MATGSISQRSSFLSALATGWVGWLGLPPVAALAFGYSGPPWLMLACGAAIAVIQVLILRVLFRSLGMHKAIWIGGVWGLVTGAALTFAAWPVLDLVSLYPIHCAIVGGFIGSQIGGYLSYFYIDDAKIHEAAAKSGEPVVYGRDAHWMEPFGYGAVAYLLVFMPRNLDLALYVVLVGAILGVFAAASSHFSPDSLKKRVATLLLLVLLGAIPGAATGWLLRNFEPLLLAPPIALGAGASVLTYLLTFLRGRMLARREHGEEA